MSEQNGQPWATPSAPASLMCYEGLHVHAIPCEWVQPSQHQKRVAQVVLYLHDRTAGRLDAFYWNVWEPDAREALPA